ncbi:MAG: GcvT family protein [Galactobacter sp.]
MSKTSPQPRIVIIGAGIVGANLADELLSRGQENILVLEQGPLRLPGGSTSHAPGFVYSTNSSKTMTEFAQYTINKLSGLMRPDGTSCFRAVGGLEIATTPERLVELERRAGWNRSYGVPAEVVDVDRVAQLHPMLDTSKVLGGLWTPTDGRALAADATAALIAKTQAAGVEYRDRTTVTGIEQANGKVTAVLAGEDRFEADVVVCCAGFWGANVAAMADTVVPLLPLAHQFAWSTPLPELIERKNEAGGGTLPILRDQDASLYYREWGDQIGIGSYAHRPMPATMADLPRYTPDQIDDHHMPSSLEFTPDDFVNEWAHTQQMIPALRNATVERGFNGIFSFTPDGGSLVGESRNVAGFFVAEAVWVTHSAGVAKAVAEVLTQGYSDTDLSGLDLHRFEDVQTTPEYVSETSQQQFREVYDIIHPKQPPASPRDVRLSPFHTQEVELGAVFLEASAWERPAWYESNASLLEQLPEDWREPERAPWAARFTSPISAAEAWKTRTDVAMYDMTTLKRLIVEGPGAEELLQRLTTSNMRRKPGAVTYTLFLNEAGGVTSDVTVARLSQEVYQVGANTNADLVYLQKESKKLATEDPTLWSTVRDITAETCCIGLWGPRARDVLSSLTADDVSNENMKYFRVHQISVAGVPVTAMRLSYVGELGWELYASADVGSRLWDLIFEAGQDFGIIPAGRNAFDSLRLEKGYRSWGSDMTTEHEPTQAGIGFAVRPEKGPFVGADALEARAATTTKRLRTITIDDPASIVLGKEPVYLAGGEKVAGYVTSAAYGFTLGHPIAYAWLPNSVELGDKVEVEYFGERLPATVQEDVMVDPGMQKIRA